MPTIAERMGIPADAICEEIDSALPFQSCAVRGIGYAVGMRGAIVFFLVVGIFTVGARAQQDTPPPKRLLIVAPERFHTGLKDFIQHKRRFLLTDLVALETVLKTASGVDDAEKLKRYLYHAWQKDHVGYVLLVGDADVLPVRYMVLDRVTPTAFDYAFYPSDLYYSDLAKADGSFDDWNARKEGFHALYFGEVRGEKIKTDPINYDEIDYLPDIAVGRWPVDTVEEVKNVAAKTIAYENGVRAGDASFRRVGMIAVGGWIENRPFMDRVAAKLGTHWTVEKRYYADGKRDDKTPPPDGAHVEQLFNDGVGLICHSGHGQDDAWDQSLSVTQLTHLKNSQHPPVIFSVGCSTARFATLPPYEPYEDVLGKTHEGTDHKEVFGAPPPPPACYQHGKHNPTGLGEQLVRGNANGAVAYIGCNTGSQPCALTLLEGFATALGQAPQPRLGDCWAEAVRYYYQHEHLARLKPNDDWYPPSIFFQGMKFMLFGDPSLQMPAAKTP